jgi:hypothetical protein
LDASVLSGQREAAIFVIRFSLNTFSIVDTGKAARVPAIKQLVQSIQFSLEERQVELGYFRQRSGPFKCLDSGLGYGLAE